MNKLNKLSKPNKLQLVANRVQCLVCNAVIESRTRHDFVTCPCGSTSVDGGTDYQRVLGNNWKDLSITTDDLFEAQRELFTWKTYGKTGMEEPEIIPLKDLTTGHIRNIVDTQMHIKGTWVEELMKKELEYRKSV
jgi:hypothetical protein